MKFLVQFTDSPETRWNVTPEQLAHVLQILSESAGRINSAGKVPAVTVIHDNGKPLCDNCGGVAPVVANELCAECLQSARANHAKTYGHECRCEICAETSQPQPLRG